MITWFDSIAWTLAFLISGWIFLSWLNSRYNEEDSDVIDAASAEEYFFKKIIRIFKRKNKG